MDDEGKDSLWKDVISLWIRYCGVSDELKTIGVRWSYLSGLNYLPLINYKDDLFERFASFDNFIGRRFERLGLQRKRIERKPDFTKATENDSTGEVESKLLEIADMFFELEEYLGRLKHVFFQRTSSLEIPMQVGLPRSVQKTMGEELLHIAADNVARTYLNSLRWNAPVVWDGLISFVYPDYEKGFRGGIFKIFPHAGVFHVSLSEDGKYFPGTMLVLAHEISHVTMVQISGGKVRDAQWLLAAFTLFCEKLVETRALSRDIVGNRPCTGCDNIEFLNSLYSTQDSITCFSQCIADILGFEIGGICSLLSFLDFAPYPEALFRVSFLIGYYKTETFSAEIVAEKERLYEKLRRRFEGQCNRSNPRVCLDLLVLLGQSLGASFREDDYSVIGSSLGSVFQQSELKGSKDLKRPLPISADGRKRICQNFFDLPCANDICGPAVPSLISHLVKRRFVPVFDGELAGQLESGTCPPLETDPRQILHVYYKLYRIRAPPSYAATIEALAQAKPPESHA
jgi:hypothetical protein